MKCEICSKSITNEAAVFLVANLDESDQDQDWNLTGDFHLTCILEIKVGDLPSAIIPNDRIRVVS